MKKVEKTNPQPTMTPSALKAQITETRESIDALWAQLRKLEADLLTRTSKPKYASNQIIESHNDDGSLFIGKVIECIPTHRGWKYTIQVHKRFYKSSMEDDRWLYKEKYQDDLFRSDKLEKNLIPSKFRPKKSAAPKRNPKLEDLGNIDITKLQEIINNHMESKLKKEELE